MFLFNIDEHKEPHFHIDFGTICWECGAELSRDTFYLKGENSEISITK